MAILSRGQTFGVTESITNTKLHNLVDLGTVSAIMDADIDPSAGIQFSKILATGIDASLFVGFANAQAAAGKWPFANLPVPLGATYVSLVSIPNASLYPINLASWVDGVAMKNIQSIPSLAGQFAWYNLVSSLASGGIPQYNGVNNFVGTLSKNLSNVLFSYSGSVDNVGYYASTSLTGAPTSNYSYWSVGGVSSLSYKTIISTKFTKISGISTVTIWAYIWTNNSNTNGQTNCKVNIGTANGNVSGTASQTTPEWKSFTIDVSGLTNGTTYDVTIQLANVNSDTSSANLGSIIALGS